jgi:hypothetical protein
LLDFFYIGLVSPQKGRIDAYTRFGGPTVVSASYVIERYGISAFFADIDAGRVYWREGDSILHTLLTWSAEDGFRQVMAQFDMEYESAHEWRNRHITALLQALMKRG